MDTSPPPRCTASCPATGIAAHLTGALAAVVLLLTAAPAHTACVGAATTLTCTGDLSSGIVTGWPYATLEVNTLTADIAPAADVAGIAFDDIGSFTLNSDTGAFIIRATGTAPAIAIQSTDGSVTINHTGGIVSESAGIGGLAATTININADADIQAVDYGIAAFAQGDTTVISTGDIRSDIGIYDISFAGDVSVSSTGDLDSGTAAIAGAAFDGEVVIHNDGNLTSQGLGIVAVSSFSHPVTVITAGDIHADGDAIALRSQAGDLTLTVNAGSNIVGGTNGILFEGGTANMLFNDGAVSAQSGPAITADTGNDTVLNAGVVTGDVGLGTGVNAFNNLPTGQLRSGAMLNIGAGNTLINAGQLSPGGIGAIQTTVFTGNFVQMATGSLLVDVDTATGLSDKVTVTGNAGLGGIVIPNILGSSLINRRFLILSADGTLMNNALTVFDMSEDYDYTLDFAGHDLFLTVQLLSIDALISVPITANQAATVAYLDRLRTSGPSAALLQFHDAVLGLATEPQIIAAIDRLNPQPQIAAAAATLQAGQGFTSSLMSCPSANETGTIPREGQCYWAQLKARTTHWDTTATAIGGTENASGVTGGVQAFVAPDWVLGGAVSYERSASDTDNAASSEGDRVSGGLVLKALQGDTTLAAAAFGGVGWYDTTRLIALPLPTVTAKGENEAGFGGAGLRLSRLFDQGGWYAKPIFDAGATYVSYGDIHETGAGVANLIVDGENQWVLNFSAALEIGGMVTIEPGLSVRPYLRVGVTKLSDADFSLTARFEGAPAGAAPFTVTSTYDDVLADLSAGLEVFAASGLSINLAYDGKFGEHIGSHAGSAKLRMAF